MNDWMIFAAYAFCAVLVACAFVVFGIREQWESESILFGAFFGGLVWPAMVFFCGLGWTLGTATNALDRAKERSLQRQAERARITREIEEALR